MDTAIFDWDAATVKVLVPVSFTASQSIQEIEIPLKSFARLLLTNVPSSWFAEIPVSDDLPLTLSIPDPK